MIAARIAAAQLELMQWLYELALLYERLNVTLNAAAVTAAIALELTTVYKRLNPVGTGLCNQQGSIFFKYLLIKVNKPIIFLPYIFCNK